MKIEFGSKLKKIRMERGMSQEELATLLGTSKQVISRYETNQRIPKITVAQEYAKKLEVPLNFLIDNNIFSSSELSETEQKIISVENDLKNLILSRYKSIREFCFAIDIPYSTIDSILKRGIENAGSGKIIKICKHLKISADELIAGKIVHFVSDPAQHSNNNLYSEFGQRLSDLRKNMGLSQSELSKMLNMPQSTYAGYETGKRKINLELIEQFSSFFEISPNLLITGKDPITKNKGNLSSREQTVIKKFRFLDDRGKISIEKMLDIQLQAMEFETNSKNSDKIS